MKLMLPMIQSASTRLRARFSAPIWRDIYVIALVSALLCAPMWVDGIFTAHDLDYHIHRLIGTMDALRAGQIPPLIAPKIANDFGYGWNLFYPPLSVYIPLLFKLMGASYIGAMKLYMFSTFFLSGVFMRRLVQLWTPHRWIPLMAALFYITAPYRLVDVYIRGAMGEILAFVFLPILFTGLYSLFKGDGKQHYYITIGGVGLLLSHNISVLLALGVSVAYVVFHWRSLKESRRFKQLLINVGFMCVLPLFFVLPLLEQKLATDYYVFEPNMMSSLSRLQGHRIYPYQLFFGVFQKGNSLMPWTIEGEMPFTLGLQLVLPLLCLPLIWKSFRQSHSHIRVFLVAGLLVSWMMTFLFNWEWMPSIFTFIQFPWRLLIFAVFFLSVPAAYCWVQIQNDFDQKHLLPLLFILFLYLTPLLTASNPTPNYTDEVYDVVDVIEAGSDKSYGAATFEYFPVSARQHLDYVTSRSPEALILSGQGEVVTLDKAYTNLTLAISTESEVVLELPYIFYLGYEVKLTTDSGVHIHLSTEESPYGFVSVTIPNELSGTLTVRYQGTTLTHIAYIASVLGLVGFAVYIVVLKRPRNRHESSSS